MYMYMFARGLNFHSFYNFSIILWNYSDILLSFDFYFIIALYSFCANAPGCVNYKKGALDSQPQVIKFTICLPMVCGSLRVLRLLPPLKLVAMI
jgi:hypothetical protein